MPSGPKGSETWRWVPAMLETQHGEGARTYLLLEPTFSDPAGAAATEGSLDASLSESSMGSLDAGSMGAAFKSVLLDRLEVLVHRSNGLPSVCMYVCGCVF